MASALKMGGYGPIVFTIIEFLVLLFTVIGTPIAQFSPKYGSSTYNMGGSSDDCDTLVKNQDAASKDGYNNCVASCKKSGSTDNDTCEDRCDKMQASFDNFTPSSWYKSCAAGDYSANQRSQYNQCLSTYDAAVNGCSDLLCYSTALTNYQHCADKATGQNSESYWGGGAWTGGAWTGNGNDGGASACQNAYNNNVNACNNSQTNCINGCNAAYAGNANDISNCTNNCSNIKNSCVAAQGNWYNSCVAGGYNTNQLNTCANDYQNAVNGCTSGNAITCNNNAWSDYQSCISKWTLHSASHASTAKGPCMTLWGYKLDCSSTKYVARGIAAFGCGQRRNNMNGGAAFAFISIFVTLILFVFGVLVVLSIWNSFLIPLILSVVATATLLICWACVAGVYNNPMCGGSKLKWEGWKYGPGFGLMVVAWILQVVNCVFAFVLMFL